MNAEIIDNAEAADRLVASLKTRADFVVLCPPGHITRLARHLRNIPQGWTAYLVNSSLQVLVTEDAAVMALSAGLSPPDGLAAVVTVPKSTTPASALSGIFKQEIPADGSRDVLVLTAPDGEDSDRTFWPLIFLNALEQVDPAAAASVYLHRHIIHRGSTN